MRFLFKKVLPLLSILFFLTLVLFFNDSPLPFYVMAFIVTILIFGLITVRNSLNFHTFFKIYQKEFPNRKTLLKKLAHINEENIDGLLILTEDRLNFIYFKDQQKYLLDFSYQEIEYFSLNHSLSIYTYEGYYYSFSAFLINKTRNILKDKIIEVDA